MCSDAAAVEEHLGSLGEMPDQPSRTIAATPVDDLVAVVGAPPSPR